MNAPPSQVYDRNGNLVQVGAKICVVSLSGQWLDDLPEDEKQDVPSMVGEVFEVEEIDEYGYPWVSKFWLDGEGETSHVHSIAFESEEMELENESN